MFTSDEKPAIGRQINRFLLWLAESAAGAETIGTVTATTNINVRASASETADRLGVLSGGDSAELVGTEGDWSKIRYNGQIGYVKSEYVQ